MKKALVIIDMQKAYFKDEPLKTQAKSLVFACNELIISALKNDVPVYLVRTEHSRSPETWTLNMLEDKKGFVFKGDDDADYLDGLYTDGTIEITKTRDSAFWRTGLLTELRQRAIESIVLGGVSTHLCITASATDAYNANIRVELASEFIASNKPQLHEIFLDYLHSEFRMPVLANSEITW